MSGCADQTINNENWHTQKKHSGLGLILSQLQNNSEIEKDSTDFEEESCLPYSNKDAILLKSIRNESSGICQAMKAFDQLGYVFESDIGEKCPDTPEIRTAAVYW